VELVLFEENKPLVLQALRDGEFDYIEAASEVFEADFFRFIKARSYLGHSWGQTCLLTFPRGFDIIWPWHEDRELSSREHYIT